MGFNRMDETWLNMAIEAMQKNDLPHARGLLRGYVSYYRRDEQGWLWLSRVVEQPEERIQCLQRVLAINPGNVAAQRELAALTGKLSRPAQPIPRAPVKPQPLAQPGPAHPPIRRPAPALSWVGVVRWIALGLTLLLFLPIGATTFPVFLGNRTLVVMSGSMEPTIPVGAVVIAEPVPSRELEIGDVIIFSPNADVTVPIIHRIVSVRVKDGTRFFTTRGDANPSADVAEVSLPATAWRMTYNVPLVGYLISYATSPLGTVIFIVMPLLLLGILTIWEQLKRTRGSFASAS
ncbi:MAG: signal peptidase I [Chloroflexota bacterium]|nr:signal peptidase I [Chloroflexota bacterium]